MFKVTVQLLTPPDVSVAGLQLNPVGAARGMSPSEKVTGVLFKVAVSVTVLGVVTAEAVATNVVVVPPAATVTEAGVVTEVLLSDNVTVVPPEGARPFKVTVHVEVPAPVTEAGLQLKADTSNGVAGTVTTPPFAVVVSGIAVAEAEDALVIRIGLLRFEPEERVKLPVATTPLGIAVEFKPLNMQV